MTSEPNRRPPASDVPAGSTEDPVASWASTAGPTMLSVRDLARSYGAVKALDGVSLEARSGEVHAVLGENGAGKSTLVRTLVGLVVPDRGTVELRRSGERADVDGRPGTEVTRGPAGSEELPEVAGVTTAAFQESSLLGNLTVAENLYFGRPQPWWRPQTGRYLQRRARAALAAVQAPPVPVDALVADLTVAQRQIVEVAKAVLADPRVLVLDEANSALSGEYNDWFLQRARAAAAEGRIVLLITHRLAEVRAVAHRITVLRGGRSVLHTEPSRCSNVDLITAMVGHRPNEEIRRRPAPEPGEPTLRAVGLHPKGALAGVDLTIARGEIVGLAGLDGQGQSEVIRALAGALRWKGRVEVAGSPYRASTPRQAVRRGVGFVPPDRQAQGLLTDWTIGRNISLTSLRHAVNRWGLVDPVKEAELVRTVAHQLSLPVERLGAPVSLLSGGNQQRVVLARVLLAAPRLLLLFDGTRGVDVATRESILDVLGGLAQGGMSILFYSSDLTEYAQLAHRVEVMSSGRIVGSVAGTEVTEANILRLAVEAERSSGSGSHRESDSRPASAVLTGAHR